jgi:hypothetical protein
VRSVALRHPCSQTPLHTFIYRREPWTSEKDIAALEQDWAHNPRWKGVKRG